MLRLFINNINYLNIDTMKKTLMIALAGMMLFAFTQCGGNKGSKEFQDSKALLEKLSEIFEKAMEAKVAELGCENEEENVVEEEIEEMVDDTIEEIQ